ncbi:hypothetical protein BTJ68_00562 [Hortaea werneckii EXF-2000]|uniref:SAP domain-containing protein n=1 Tax=Hortaea werneckii EXF-2000 TaxID=1157616 RepID=A0A1Z5TU69_HORWE|nr:hypothetical protein BTJ68_00562 [Hortaea werneckii EXF-2000]
MSAATDYSKLKVTELKDLLKERGIASTGLTRKQQIVEALEEEDGKSAAEQTEEPEAVDPIDEGAEGKELEGEEEKVEAAVDEVAQAATDGEQEANQKGEKEGMQDQVEDAKGDAPVVLETDQPVSQDDSNLVTPREASPIPHDASSDTRKRKRRSPTPPVSQDAINKKLKSADDAANAVALPEDRVVKDAPAPTDGANEPQTEDAPEKVQPYGSSDDVMDIQKEARPESQGNLAKADTAPTTDHAERPAPETMAMDDGDDDTLSSSGALHPATRALYIRELIRPLQPNDFRKHLVDLATPQDQDLDDSIIETFHLDPLRSHAFAVFTSTSAAARARTALHNTVWPAEPTRKPLWVDFVPEDKVGEWIERELAAGTSRRDAKRWEVVYESLDSGVEARLQEVGPPPPPTGPSSSGGGRRRESRPSHSSPGVDDPSHPPTRRPSSRTPPPRRPSTSPDPAEGVPPSQDQPPPPSQLDTSFHHTVHTKPKIYYLPQPPSLVSARLHELDSLTSRAWTQGGEWKLPLTGVDGALRRYTFEDGDRLVDGGADRGSFGVPVEARRGGGSGGVGTKEK